MWTPGFVGFSEFPRGMHLPFIPGPSMNGLILPFVPFGLTKNINEFVFKFLSLMK